MTAGNWKASHIASIGFMAAVLFFLVFAAGAGESSQLLSSASSHEANAAQTTSNLEVADCSR